MNTIFRDGDNLYKIVRETPKTYFYKMILPTQKRVGNKSLLFFFQQSVSYKKYDPNHIILHHTERKTLKTCFHPEQEINFNEFGNHFLMDYRWVEIDENILNNHLFFDEDEELFKMVFQLRFYVESLKSHYIKIRLDRNEPGIKEIFNHNLLKLKSLYDDWQSTIIDNMDRIVFTIDFKKLQSTNFEERLNELYNMNYLE